MGVVIASGMLFFMVLVLPVWLVFATPEDSAPSLPCLKETCIPVLTPMTIGTITTSVYSNVCSCDKRCTPNGVQWQCVKFREELKAFNSRHAKEKK